MEGNEFIHDIFIARCKDTGERPKREEANHFRKQMLTRCKGPTFELRESRLGPNAAMAISKVLRGNTELIKLDLYGNVIRDGGCQAIVELLLTPTCRIQYLNLGCNDIGEDGGIALGEMLKFNKTLQVLELGAGSFVWHDNNLGPQAGLAIAEGLESNHTLTALGLNRNLIGGGTNITGNGSGNNTARSFDRTQSDEAPAALAKMLTVNTTLATLKMGHNNLGNRGGIILAEAMLINKTLQHIDLSDNALGPDVGVVIGQVLAIDHGNLAILNLKNNKLGSRGAAAISEAIANNRTLVSLQLDGNNIGDKGAAAVAEGLAKNKTITQLNLSSNGIGPAGGVALAQSIKKHEVLVTLCLNANGLQDEAAIAIAASLKTDQALFQLELSSCKISDAGGIALAEAIEHHPSLQTLKLHDNFLTEGGGKQMSQSIAKNNVLTSIDVTGNQLTHTTIKHINSSLKRNRNMQKLIEAAPLKMEIIRLRSQQSKLPLTEAELAAQIEALEAAERAIHATDAQIGLVRADGMTEIKHLQKKLDDIDALLQEEQKRLADREEELQKVVEEYDTKIRELQATLNEELERKNALETELKDKTTEIEEFLKEHDSVMAELQNKIYTTRKETAEFRAKEKELTAEIERIKKESEGEKDGDEASPQQKKKKKKKKGEKKASDVRRLSLAPGSMQPGRDRRTSLAVPDVAMRRKSIAVAGTLAASTTSLAGSDSAPESTEPSRATTPVPTSSASPSRPHSGRAVSLADTKLPAIKNTAS